VIRRQRAGALLLALILQALIASTGVLGWTEGYRYLTRLDTRRERLEEHERASIYAGFVAACLNERMILVGDTIVHCSTTLVRGPGGRK
jgi:hypothetical protein